MLQPRQAADQPVYVVAGGNHVTILLDRAEAGVRVADPLTPPDHEPPGPGQLREISARWGVEFWTGPVDTSPPTG